MKTIVELKEISKYFLYSRALNGVDLSIVEDECLGIVGHNGAGKSTLVNILTGTLPQTSGDLLIDGAQQGAGYDVVAANRLGIRAVFQELSLCPNLSIVENMKVFHPRLRGRGWRARAERAIMETMDAVFPGHGMRPNDVVESLTLGQRQIVEIAKAFTIVDMPLRLVILDEPTSALDHRTSRQLLRFLDTLRGREISVIYISHLLEEVLACTDRIVVLKDGATAGTLKTAEATRQRIIELMGEAKPEEVVLSAADGTAPKDEASGAAAGAGNAAASNRDTASGADAGGESADTGGELVIKPRIEDGEKRIRVGRGEIVGLTGLAGHGQTRLLIELFDYRKNREYEIRGPVTFIPGDRQSDGVFPIWSVMKNLTVEVYDAIRKFMLIDTNREADVANKWKDLIDIRTDSVRSGILSLSGGNQQKVLFARCLESDSPIVLMDDPTRGVDVGTKEEIYRLILEEKRKGRSFVWYTTEMDELRYCDMLYVFKGGKILAELPAGQATEEEVLKASF